MRRRARMLFTAVFALAGWWAASQAASFPMTGRLMPMLAAVSLTVFAVLHLIGLIIEDVRERSVPVEQRRASTEMEEGKSMALGEGHMRTLPPVRAAFGRHLLGWFLGCLLAVAMLGTWVGGAVFIIVFALVELPEQRWFGPVLVGVALSVIALLVFVLEVDIPQSLLLEWSR